jgi:hypothetical protein
MSNRLHDPKRVDYLDATSRQLLFYRNSIDWPEQLRRCHLF